MPRIESRVEIGAPPATVFPWLVDPDRLARWISGFVGSEPIGSGEVRVGSRSRDIIEAEDVASSWRRRSSSCARASDWLSASRHLAANSSTATTSLRATA